MGVALNTRGVDFALGFVMHDEEISVLEERAYQLEWRLLTLKLQFCFGQRLKYVGCQVLIDDAINSEQMTNLVEAEVVRLVAPYSFLGFALDDA